MLKRRDRHGAICVNGSTLTGRRLGVMRAHVFRPTSLAESGVASALYFTPTAPRRSLTVALVRMATPDRARRSGWAEISTHPARVIITLSTTVILTPDSSHERLPCGLPGGSRKGVLVKSLAKSLDPSNRGCLPAELGSLSTYSRSKAAGWSLDDRGPDEACPRPFRLSSGCGDRCAVDGLSMGWL